MHHYELMDLNIFYECQSDQAAVTKYHRLGGLNSGSLLLTVLEAKKSKIKVLEDRFQSNAPLTCTQPSLCSQCLSLVCM